MSVGIVRQLEVFYLFFKFALIIPLKSLIQGKERCQCKTKLDGKIALITGGNSGIGLETARDLARRGATVIIASRNVKKSEEAVNDIISSTGNPKVYFKSLNLLKFSSITKFVEDFNKNFNRLDILVNNSGCVIGKQNLSEDGIEKVIQINYVGPFLLTNLLMEKLIISKSSRIVIVSSLANEFHNFDPEDLAGVRSLGAWTRYSNSKLLNILWAKALAQRLPEGVTANALHPGLVRTEIFNSMSERMRKFVLWVINMFFKDAEEGAQTTIHLCVAPELEGVSGEFFDECRISSACKVTRDEKLVGEVWEKTLKLVKDRMPKAL